MPFIRIDTIAGHYGYGQRAAIGDVLQDAVRGIGAGEGDRLPWPFGDGVAQSAPKA